jgi:glycosyltransferase involved in cell wall biosynthesis
MKVSIITVCYNSVFTIKETLLSVAAQTHQDLEHIIVDGDSKDGTQEVVKKYSGRIAKFISEPDRGIYDAMNKGLDLSKGDIIGFLNADDIYNNNYVLERVSKVFERDNFDAVIGDVEFRNPMRLSKPLRRYRSYRFRPERIAWGWMPAHPALFLKYSVYERFGKFRTDYRIAGDFEMVARIFNDGTITYWHLPEVLVCMKTGGISTGGWRNTILLNKEVLRACRENGIATNLSKILTKYPIKLLEFLQK